MNSLSVHLLLTLGTGTLGSLTQITSPLILRLFELNRIIPLAFLVLPLVDKIVGISGPP